MSWIEEFPREKLLTQGPQSLTDAELLAIFYRVGIKGKPVVSLAKEHLAQVGSLRSLLDTSYEEARCLEGMGLTKYVSLQASLELGKRYLKHSLKKSLELNHVSKVIDFLRLQFRGYDREVIVGLFLDAKNYFIASSLLAEGGLTSVQLYPRTLVKQALMYNASGLIVAHQHLSGDPTPSHADKMMTVMLKEVLEKIEIRLMDHIIVGDGSYISFAQEGYL